MMTLARLLNPAALLGLGLFVGFYLGYRTGHEQARYERNREMARGHDWKSRMDERWIVIHDAILEFERELDIHEDAPCHREACEKFRALEYHE